MPLCGSYSCGCGLSVDVGGDLTLSGSGEAGDPWVLGIAEDPDGIAKGIVAYSALTADITNINSGGASEVDTGLSVSWTAVAGRRYLVTAEISLQSGASDTAAMIITDASNVMKQYIPHVFGGSTAASRVLGSVVETGLSGTITRKVRVQRTSGSGNMNIAANASYPCELVVYDVGNL